MNIKLISAFLLAPLVVSASDLSFKNRSTFRSTTETHNPFWPIGWTKAPGVANTAVAATLVKADDFIVSSILINEPPLAVINGKEMAEGEVLVMKIGGQSVTVQLAAVQDGQVILRYQDQNIIVPLHRRGESQMRGTTAMK